MEETGIQIEWETVNAVTLDASGALYVSTSCRMNGRYVAAIITRFGPGGDSVRLFVDQNARDFFPDVPSAPSWAIIAMCAANGVLTWADERRFVVALKGTVMSRLIYGGVGFGNWDRHEGGDPDADPPWFSDVSCDRTGDHVVVADPRYRRIVRASLATKGDVTAMSVGDRMPSSVAVDATATYFSDLDTLYRAEFGSEIRAIAHVGAPVNDNSLAVGPDEQLFCGVGESVVCVDKTSAVTTLARCSGLVRAIAVSEDSVVFADDAAIREHQSLRITL